MRRQRGCTRTGCCPCPCGEEIVPYVGDVGHLHQWRGCSGRLVLLLRLLLLHMLLRLLLRAGTHAHEWRSVSTIDLQVCFGW
jgi:hypothetical protein